MLGSLALLFCDPLRIVLGQPAADGTGLLRAEVERRVLLVLVEQAELVSLLGVDDGEDAGDRLADVRAANSISVSKEAPFPPFQDPFFSSMLPPKMGTALVWCVHSVQLGTRRSDLLDAELAELGLEFTKLLGQFVLVLPPQLGGLNLGCRLIHISLATMFD